MIGTASLFKSRRIRVIAAAMLAVLAADELANTAIIRVQVDERVEPLPLNSAVYPGDAAWCYSDPLGRSSFFSKGMVNRFFEMRRRGKRAPRMDVSTDWAPGSSGADVQALIRQGP